MTLNDQQTSLTDSHTQTKNKTDVFISWVCKLISQLSRCEDVTLMNNDAKLSEWSKETPQAITMGME